MTDLTLTATWHDEIYQIATTDPVLGGPPSRTPLSGVANLGVKEVAENTLWLKQKIGGLGAEAGTITDLNSVNKTGIFQFGATAAGHPNAGHVGSLTHTEINSDLATQTAHLANGEIATRARSAGPVWSTWLITKWGQANEQALTENGYQKLPSGLIFQWGLFNRGLTPWPIPFPNACLQAVVSDDADGNANLFAVTGTESGCRIQGDTPGPARVFAVGY